MPIKIVVAPNAFKGSLTAVEAASAIRSGILAALPDANVLELPVADGGDGTTDVLVSGTGGAQYTQDGVLDPLGKMRTAVFGILGDAKTAVVEMASASGLTLVPPKQRNPMKTTTYGTGQLIKACLDHGCTRIIIGVGGSATVDGGAGMAQALGVKLTDGKGQELRPGARDLAKLRRIDTSGFDRRLHGVEIIVACDVDNPLTGANGAARIFGPQKGALPAMVERLSINLEHYAEIIENALGKQTKRLARGGAAGGLAAGLFAFLDGQLVSGIDLILDVLNFETALIGADLVITGEGRIDAQTIYGKAPIGVAHMAKKLGIPVIAFAGSISDDAAVVYEHGIDALIPITPHPMPLDEAMQNARPHMRNAAEHAIRLLLTGKRLRG